MPSTHRTSPLLQDCCRFRCMLRCGTSSLDISVHHEANAHRTVSGRGFSRAQFAVFGRLFARRGLRFEWECCLWYRQIRFRLAALASVSAKHTLHAKRKKPKWNTAEIADQAQLVMTIYFSRTWGACWRVASSRYKRSTLRFTKTTASDWAGTSNVFYRCLDPFRRQGPRCCHHRWRDRFVDYASPTLPVFVA